MFLTQGCIMSGQVLKVMKQHLKIAEKYISDLEEADSKESFMKAMKSCGEKIKKQYPDLEAISEEYNTLMVLNTASDELKNISNAVGDCFGRKSTVMIVKTAAYLAHDDFREAQAELDNILTQNPLFGGNIPDDKALMQVSESFASSMNSMAEKLHLETSEADMTALDKIESILKDFDALADKFAASVKKADTARKLVNSVESFVTSVKKLIPEMQKVAEPMRIMMAQKLLPEQVSDISKHLRKTLGTELPEILRDKREFMAEPKVKKAVYKLGEIVGSLPF